jgi:hypothetical protein
VGCHFLGKALHDLELLGPLHGRMIRPGYELDGNFGRLLDCLETLDYIGAGSGDNDPLADRLLSVEGEGRCRRGRPGSRARAPYIAIFPGGVPGMRSELLPSSSF